MKWLFFLLFPYLLWHLLQQWPSHYLQIVTCDVGQGDAILLQFLSLQLLIDTGPNQQVLNCLEENMPMWDKRLEVVILTHFDDDHIGGVESVAKNYQISFVFLPLSEYKESAVYLEMQTALLALQSMGTKLKEPFLGQQIVFSEFSLTDQSKKQLSCVFLTPFQFEGGEYLSLEENALFVYQKTEKKLTRSSWDSLQHKISDNNGSIVLFCQFVDLKMLFVGDLESTREQALYDMSLLTRVDIQKIGHHGSKSSSSLSFMENLRPETSLISCGKNNKFNHPHQETLDTLSALRSRVYRTDLVGHIKINTDGLKYWLPSVE